MFPRLRLYLDVSNVAASGEDARILPIEQTHLAQSIARGLGRRKTNVPPFKSSIYLRVSFRRNNGSDISRFYWRFRPGSEGEEDREYQRACAELFIKRPRKDCMQPRPGLTDDPSNAHFRFILLPTR